MTRLDEIRARCEKATPGPWEEQVMFHSEEPGHSAAGPHCVPDLSNEDVDELEADELAEEQAQADAAFIAAARSDVPWLVSEVERLRAGLMLVASIVESSEADDADVLVIVGREARAVLNGDVR